MVRTGLVVFGGLLFGAPCVGMVVVVVVGVGVGVGVAVAVKRSVQE